MASYAGIGARKTPIHIIEMMRETAVLLAKDGYTCNTGAALGADQAFANGAASVNGHVQLFIPWANYEKEWIANVGGPGFFPDIYVANPVINTAAFNSVNQFHPAPDNLSKAVKALHARNWLILNNTEFVICWTPNGQTTGGTGQAIRIAEYYGKHVYNIGDTGTLAAFEAKIEERRTEL